MIGALEARAGRLLYDTAARVRPGGWLDRVAFGTLRLLSNMPFLAGRARLILGRLHILRGETGQAERWLSSAVTVGSARVGSTRYHLGSAQLAVGQFDSAIENLRVAVRAHPHRHWYHLKLATALQAHGLQGEAEAHIRMAVQAAPSSAWAHYQLFMALRPRLGEGGALDAWLDSVLSVTWVDNPEIHPELWLNHHDIYSAERVRRVEQVIERYPGAHDCRLLLAYLLRYSDNPAAGVPQLRAASLARWQQRFATDAKTTWDVAGIPAFLVIGLPKAGSTALYDYLCRHPLICPAQAKEINFWTHHYTTGLDWYRACFPPIPADSPCITGEATNSIFWHPEAPDRIARHYPDMKLVLIIREPVQRAFSEYSMYRRQGGEERAWADYVKQRLTTLPSCPTTAEELASVERLGNDYLLKSAVLPYMERWGHFAGRGNLLLLRNEDLGAATRETMNRLFAYLGLPPHDIVSPPRVNVGTYSPQPEALQLRLAEWYRPHEQALQDYLRKMAHG